MANLTFSATATAGTITHTSATYTDATMTRFTDWCWYAYPQYVVDGDPSSGVKTKNNANVAAAVRDAFAALVEGLKANVIRYEKSEAAQAAQTGVPDFEAG